MDSLSHQIGRDYDSHASAEYDMYTNKNIDWMSGRSTFICYIFFCSLLWGIFHLAGHDPKTCWTSLNVIHGVLTFIFFHWIKGCPDDSNQGDYNHLTLFEQIDGGIPWTVTKKFLMLAPTVLAWSACHFSHYEPNSCVTNIGIFLICIIAKIPEMHRVRIFGINSSLGVDIPVEITRTQSFNSRKSVGKSTGKRTASNNTKSK